MKFESQQKLVYSLFFGCLLLCPTLCHAQSTPLSSFSRKDRIAAAALYHIAQFVKWPAQPSSSDQSFVFCLVGQNRFNEAMAETIKNKNVVNRSATVVTFPTAESFDEKSCNVVFTNQNISCEKVPPLSPDSHILSICNGCDVKLSNCAVSFAEADNKLQLKINLQNVRRSGLEIGSELLDLADVVDKR